MNRDFAQNFLTRILSQLQQNINGKPNITVLAITDMFASKRIQLDF